jgi:hypothetical protein
VPKIKPGGVYEIKLVDKYYVYVCEIAEFDFGLFDIVSETPIEIETLVKLKFRDYKASKRTGITKKVWKKIGTLNLEERNIRFPDLVTYLDYDPEGFIERSIIMRNGNLLKVPKEYYLDLLEKEYIYGFFDNYINYENHIVKNLINNKLIQLDEDIRAAWYRKRMEELKRK